MSLRLSSVNVYRVLWCFLVVSGAFSSRGHAETVDQNASTNSYEDDISEKPDIFLEKTDNQHTFDNTNKNPTNSNQNITGRGSAIFTGNGTTNFIGTSVLMNPSPETIFPKSDATPQGGNVVVRHGDVNIVGSGANTGEMIFVADQANSSVGNVVDRETGAVVGRVEQNGQVTAIGSDDNQKSQNASRLHGFVANNNYTIVGEGDRGNMLVASGAVLDNKTGSVVVGLAGTSRGSTLTVDDAWVNADKLTIGNGDNNYNTDAKGDTSQPNGRLNVTNGGIVNAGDVAAGNYLGSQGVIQVAGNADTVNHSADSQSVLTANKLYVNGSGTGQVDIGDGQNSNSGFVVARNGVAFGAPSDSASSTNSGSEIRQEHFDQKSGILNIEKGGTLSTSDSRDSNGNVTSNAITAADNEKSYKFNLNGGTLQRGNYNDSGNVKSALTTALDVSVNKTSNIDSNNGDVVLAGKVSGDGGLNKINQGNLILTNNNSFSGDVTVDHGGVRLGNNNSAAGDLGNSKAVHLTNQDSSLVVDRSNTLALRQNITGRGSAIFTGNGTTNFIGTSVLMNPSPENIFPKSDATPQGGNVVVRHGDINIVGSGANTGDMSFVADQPNSSVGSIVDKETGAVVGRVEQNGQVTATGSDDNQKAQNASRLHGFVANNNYTIVGEGDRGNMLVASGAVLDNSNGSVVVGLAGTSRGSTLTVDDSWVNADKLTVGNGDNNYNTDAKGDASQPNGRLNVTNGGIVNAGVVTAGNYLGSQGVIQVAGNADTANHSADSQSVLAADKLYVNGSGVGQVDIGDGQNPNSGFVAARNGVVFGAPSDSASSTSANSETRQELFDQKSGILNLETGGTLSASDSRDSNGNVTSNAITAADNEKSYKFNLNGGTLQRGNYNDSGNVKSALTTALDVSVNKTSNIDSNNGDVVLAGKVSGDGGLNKINQGNLILTNNNSFSGDVTVDHGGVRLGNNNSAAGDLGNSKAVHLTNQDSSLVVDRSNNLTLNQTIDGNGGVTQSGTGKTSLTNNNSFAGDVTVDRGSVSLGQNNSSTGDAGNSKAIHLVNQDSSLVVDRSNNLTLDQTIDGKGGVTQSGTGMTVLTGSNSYTGDTNIEGGNLRINGDQRNATGQTNVRSGGTLSGTGNVGGSVTVNNGGTISAGEGNGDTPQRMTISGSGNPNQENLTLENGGILNSNIGTDPSSGDHKVGNYTYHEGNVVYVTGKARFGEGSIINLSTESDVKLRYNVGYRVLVSTDGIEGDLSKVKTQKNYLFLDQKAFRESEAANGTVINDNGQLAQKGADNSDAVDIILRRNSSSYQSIGVSGNERQTGNALDHMDSNSDLVQSFGVMTDKGEARHALNSLSGEVHASIRTALIQDSFYTRQAVLDRLATADCDGMVTGSTIRTADWKTRRRTEGKCVSDRAVWWGQAYGGMGHNDSTSGTAGMSHSVAGFIMGADTPLKNNWRIGGFVGYSHSMMNVGARDSSGHSDNVSLGMYTAKHWGNFHLRAGAGYTWNIVNARRHVNFEGFNDRTSNNQNGGTVQAFGEAAYRFKPTSSVRVEPFIDMAYVNLHTRGFKENGGEAALNGKGTAQGVGFMTFGTRASTRLQVGKSVVNPYGMIAYRHAFGATSPTVHQSFVSGSSDMNINGAPLSEDTAVMEFGVQAQLTDMMDINLSYLGQYGNHSHDNGGRANLRIRF